MTVAADYCGNLTNIDLFAEPTKRQLRDRGWLEDVLLNRLGLYPAEGIPQQLWNCGGLGLCQFPNQFAPYLIALSKLELRSYAEIGIWVGGALIVTVEYLKRFGLKRALGIDVTLQESAKRYAESAANVMLLQAPSDSSEAAKTLEGFQPDLVLIDGDHSAAAARSDWVMSRQYAKWVAFHDIVGCPGVMEVWNEIEGPKREWVEQYDYFPGSHAGLGLVKCESS